MAITIVMKKDDGDQVEMTLDPECRDDSDWEEVCYQKGCEVARKLATWCLGHMEERLRQEHPQDMQIDRFCERALMSRFGEVTVGRRLYQYATQGEKAEWHDCFEHGKLTPPGRWRVPLLYAEFALFHELDNYGARGGIPALEGPHASRPWAGVLRSMTQAGYRVK